MSLKKPLFQQPQATILRIQRTGSSGSQNSQQSPPKAPVAPSDKGRLPPPTPGKKEAPIASKGAGNAIGDNQRSSSKTEEPVAAEEDVKKDSEPESDDDGTEIKISHSNLKKIITEKNRKLIKGVKAKREGTKEKRVPDSNYRSIQKTVSLSLAEWNLINKHSMMNGGFSRFVRKMFFDELRIEKRPHPEGTDIY